MENKKYSHWQIAYRRNKEMPFELINNPDWAWAADPFVVEYDGKIMVFAELFLYKSERNGVIGYCIWEGDKFGSWTVTMDKHWHLSYPNVWVENDKLYMCPETYQLEEVCIYELIELPDKWKKVKILMQNDKYVDTTFLKYRNESYMITYSLCNSNILGKCLLYKLRDNKVIDNPIVISENIENARPAGNFYINENNELIRVSQNSLQEYGKGLVLSKVESVYPIYKEKEIDKIFVEDICILSEKTFTGVHTYNRYKDFEVIDLKYDEYSAEEVEASDRVRKVFLNKY